MDVRGQVGGPEVDDRQGQATQWSSIGWSLFDGALR